jgi:hypothetical protein
MAATLRFQSLRIYLNQYRATAQFLCSAGRADIPLRGASVSWVVDDSGNAIGANWVVDNTIVVEQKPHFVIEVTARMPGLDWTWVDAGGNPLRPIGTRGSYALFNWSGGKMVDGIWNFGYWNFFSNWSDDYNWTPDESDPIQDSLETWEIEFVDSTAHGSWHQHKNGSWPTGFSSYLPSPTASYLCQKIEVKEEPYMNPITGVATTYYRHWAVFWKAPAIGGTQLVWDRASW